MFLLISLIISGAVFSGEAIAAEANQHSQTMIRAGSEPSYTAPSKYFTGNAQVDPLCPATDLIPFSAAYVTFEPGAHTAWHIHPAGQRLIVTAGVGLTQEWGGPVIEVHPGDVIWCPPGVKHWHGASPSTAMTHLAMSGVFNGKSVEWLEKVSDDQYYTSVLQAQTISNLDLSAKEQGIVTIAAFTAIGNLEKLKTALNDGLDAGLTVNEIKEVLVQMYAYTGFPRSLNGINTFITVMDERERKGIKDEVGREASPLPADKSSLELGTDIQTHLIGKPSKANYIAFTPAIDQYLKGHLFGDIFGRDNLNFQSRELATISALASMEGVTPQLQGHFNVGFNVGLTEAQMRSLISVLETRVGKQKADHATIVLNNVINSRNH